MPERPFCYVRAMAEIEIIENASDEDIAGWLEREVLAPLLSDGREVKIAVPGGSTPFPIFEELTRRNLDFARLMIWPTDDRIVPEDHAASNTGKIRAIFEPRGATVFALDNAPVPTLPSLFDLVWLGMGADGHIASLFPNVPHDLCETGLIQRIRPDPLPPEAPFDRITLTMPVLANCRRMIFVMRGEEKRRVFDAAANGEGDLPIARLMRKLHATHGVRVTCFT